MSKYDGVTDEDFEIFKSSNIPFQAKENAAKNINKGIEYETAFDTPHGRILLKDLQDTLVSELTKITSHRHNPEKPIAWNYDNLLVAINKYQVAEEMKCKWEGILKTKNASLQMIKGESTKIKNNNRNNYDIRR